MAIKVRAADTAAQLAAGEVIERPAAVVRELLDNALDAGARNISVHAAGGGLDILSVSDDGCGLSAGDLALCTQRHSTSKLRRIEDLANLSSLGFRGEALYSIAGVSRLRIKSRPPGTPGCEVEYDGERVVRQAGWGGREGTQVEVRDLFYNTPARLRFLKGPTTESARIERLLKRYILGHPGVRFTLSVDGREVLRSPGTGDLQQAMAALYGWQLSEQLLPVEAYEGGVSVAGFVATPQVSRRNRADMNIFVNNRWVESRSILYAVQDAYSSLLMVGRFPVVALQIRVPPDQLDVNVHPAKSEVRFADERGVTSLTSRAVRAALLPASGRGADDTDQQPLSVLQYSFSPREVRAPDLGPLPAPTATTADFPAPEEVEPFTRLPSLRILGQLAHTYIIAEGPSGMCLIDQHAAHERVVLENLQDSFASGTLESQTLLEPLLVPLTSAQRDGISDLVGELRSLGFEAEPFGGETLLVRSVPAALPSDRVGPLLEALQEGLEGLAGAEERHRGMVATLACHSAIRAGRVLDLVEMRSLIQQLEKTRFPLSCAHGRPTLLELSHHELEREFGRRGSR